MSSIKNYWNLYLWNSKWDKLFKKIEFPFKYKNNFNPYQNNGGTIISVSGRNFSIIAADTRCSSGFSISTRFQTRIIKISKKTLLATSGMFADIKFFEITTFSNVPNIIFCMR